MSPSAEPDSKQDLIISLLKDINESLAAIRNQCKNHTGFCGLSTCSCHWRDNSAGQCQGFSALSTLPTDHIGKPVDLVSHANKGFVENPSFEDCGGPGSTIEVHYGDPSPIDRKAHVRFDAQCSSILTKPEVKERLGYLPPDDYRCHIPVTRGEFLKLFLTDLPQFNVATDVDAKEILAGLSHIRESQAQLYPGHFWIRDYDENGSFVHWDCVNPPKTRGAEKQGRSIPLQIPTSTWPVGGSTEAGIGTPGSWRRIISCRNLPRLVNSGGVVQNPFFHDSSQLASMHLHQRLRYHGAKVSDYCQNVQKRVGCLFQVTYAKNTNRDLKDMAPSAWRNGFLYPGGRHRSTEFESITIEAISSRLVAAVNENTPLVPDEHWTIVILEPMNWFRVTPDEALKKAMIENSSMQVALLILVSCAVSIAAIEWEKMVAYFDTLLGYDFFDKAESSLLSPETHDLLLFEDESFSRSRKYFWAIEALTTFIDRISEIIDAWRRYKKHEVTPYLKSTSWREYDQLARHMEKAESEVSKLERIQSQLEKHLERTKLSRDGLFSASAVIESRTSTTLGRNIKLLTYVSIFYLPLSFCASLWSTTNQFGFDNLAIVMAVVSVTTNGLMFNIENLVKMGHSIYTPYRKKIIERMILDLRTNEWETRARRFEQFVPNRHSDRPTEYYVLWAGFLLFVGDIRYFFHPGLTGTITRLFGGSNKSNVYPSDNQDQESNHPTRAWAENRTPAQTA